MYVDYQQISNLSIFGDKRLSSRFSLVLNSLESSISTSISQAQKTSKDQAGFYRFMNNENVTHERILLTAQETCIAQVKTCSSPVILCVSDTTEINYTGKPVSSKLGCLSQAYQKGYFTHNQMLMDEDGLSIGVYGQETYNRDPDTIGTARRSTKRQTKPFKERESYRWVAGFTRLNNDFATQLDKTFVHISDRESDLHELVASPRHKHIHYLFRAKFDRKVNETEKLFAYAANLPLQNTIKVTIPTKGNHHIKREITLEVRYTNVTFSANGYTSKEQNGKLATTNYIEFKEINAPQGIEPIHWRLVTSLSIDTLEQVLTILKYYLLRWRIEEFHVILKQGCAIEELNFEEPEAIKNLIAIYSIISAKILNFRYLFDKKPDAAIEILGYTQQDYKVLEKYWKHKTNNKTTPVQNPTAADFILLIQKLGSGEKNPKKVGVRALWMGLGIAQTILEAYQAFLK